MVLFGFGAPPSGLGFEARRLERNGHDLDAPVVWDRILDKGKGVITCPGYSKRTNRSMAIARLDLDVAKQGVGLEVRGANVKAKAIAHTITFNDPEKKKRTAQDQLAPTIPSVR